MQVYAIIIEINAAYSFRMVKALTIVSLQTDALSIVTVVVGPPVKAKRPGPQAKPSVGMWSQR
jgi:hypothetical protein